MNTPECNIAQNLIIALDDTRLVYRVLAPRLAHSQLKYLVGGIAESHAVIADRLAWLVRRARALPVRRGGGSLAGFRAVIESGMATLHFDVELGCMRRVAFHEASLIHRFYAALDATDGLYLERDIGELERGQFRIESLLRHAAAATVSSPAHLIPIPIRIVSEQDKERP